MKALRIVGAILVGLVFLAGILALLTFGSVIVVNVIEYIKADTGPTADAVLLFLGRVAFITAYAGTILFFAWNIGEAFFDWLSVRKVNRSYKKGGIKTL